MKEMARRVQRIETQAKRKLSTVHELIDFVLSVQRGEVSIHSAVMGAELLGLLSKEAIRWQTMASKIATKHDKPVEEVQRELISHKPELARYFPLCD